MLNQVKDNGLPFSTNQLNDFSHFTNAGIICLVMHKNVLIINLNGLRVQFPFGTFLMQDISVDTEGINHALNVLFFFRNE